MGKDAPLFHFAVTDYESSVGVQYAAEAQNWSDSVWQSVAQPVTP